MNNNWLFFSVINSPEYQTTMLDKIQTLDNVCKGTIVLMLILFSGSTDSQGKIVKIKHHIYFIDNFLKCRLR